MQPLVDHPVSYSEKMKQWWRGARTTGTMNSHPRYPLILLVSGWAGSGKDAAAALLAEELGFTRYSFADALKRDASAETGIPLSDFHAHGIKDSPMKEPHPSFPHAKTPREILLKHGAVARGHDPDIYSRAVAHDIEEEMSSRVVISDWRMLREREYLAKHFPTATILTLRITRKGVDPRAEKIEHELDEFPFDLQIANDGCISDLRDALRHTIRPYLGTA